jgi:hypothetical protein
MAFELVSNRGADEIGPVRVKAVPDHQIDMAKIDVAEIDRDLFGIARLWPKLMHILCHLFHPYDIHTDGYGAPTDPLIHG